MEAADVSVYTVSFLLHDCASWLCGVKLLCSTVHLLPWSRWTLKTNDVKKNNEKKEKVYSVMAPCGATAAAVWIQSQSREKWDGGFSETEFIRMTWATFCLWFPTSSHVNVDLELRKRHMESWYGSHACWEKLDAQIGKMFFRKLKSLKIMNEKNNCHLCLHTAIFRTTWSCQSRQNLL